MYWSSIFIIPKKTIKSIEQKFSYFLWLGNETANKRAKMVYESVYVPKNEDDLGLKMIVERNKVSLFFFLTKYSLREPKRPKI